MDDVYVAGEMFPLATSIRRAHQHIDGPLEPDDHRLLPAGRPGHVAARQL